MFDKYCFLIVRGNCLIVVFFPCLYVLVKKTTLAVGSTSSIPIISWARHKDSRCWEVLTSQHEAETARLHSRRFEGEATMHGKMLHGWCWGWLLYITLMIISSLLLDDLFISIYLPLIFITYYSITTMIMEWMIIGHLFFVRMLHGSLADFGSVWHFMFEVALETLWGGLNQHQLLWIILDPKRCDKLYGWRWQAGQELLKIYMPLLQL